MTGSFYFSFQCSLFNENHVRGHLPLSKISFTFHSSDFPKCFNDLVYYIHQNFYPGFACKYLNDNLFKISKKHYVTILDKLNDLPGKNFCFTEFSTKFMEILGWLLLTFFIYLNDQLSSFNSIIIQMSEKRVHQIESKNEWLLLSVTLTAKFELVFLLTSANAFS